MSKHTFTFLFLGIIIGKFVIGFGWCFYVMHCKGQIGVGLHDIVGKELREDWIQGNIYPLNERDVATKILNGRQ